MNEAKLKTLVRQVRSAVRAGDDPCDRELLRAYAAGHSGAFDELVRRYGPMVWHVCRRALHHHQDAEDAFQATFLVLARKAPSAGWQESVAAWLYTVAQRVATRARSRRRPAPRVEEAAGPDPLAEISGRDLLQAVDEEVAALSVAFRGPVVLCLLEGRTQEEAARLLGASLSTVRRRLEVGKKRLRARLARRGLAPAVALGAMALARTVTAGHPAALPASGGAVALARGAAVTSGPHMVGLGALVLFAFGVGLAAYSAAVGPPPARRADRPEALPRTDSMGDPLPAGVVQRLGTVRFRHPNGPVAAAYSPDGKRIASVGNWSSRVVLWEAATGKEVGHLDGPKKGLGSIAFSPDGRLLTAAGGNHVHVWDAETMKVRHCLPAPKAEALAFARKGDTLATAGGDHVRLWDARAGRLLRSIEVKGAGFGSVALSPDGAVVAACADRSARVWRARDGKLLHHFEDKGHSHTGVLFSPDGLALLTTAYGRARLWDVATGKSRGELKGPSARGHRGAFSPDGKRLAVAGDDHVVRLLSWPALEVVQALPRQPDRLRWLAFSPDSTSLVTIADGAALHLWDVKTGRPRLDLPGHRERLTSVGYSADGRTVVTAAWDGMVRLWDARAGQEQLSLDARGKRRPADPFFPDALQEARLSPDGQLVAVTSRDFVILFDVRSKKEVRRFDARCFAFAPGGKQIACGESGPGGSGLICLYDLVTGKRIREMAGHKTPLSSLIYSPDGQSLISSGVVFRGLRSGEPGEREKEHVRIWDVETGEPRRGLPGARSALAISPDGRTVASASLLDRSVVLYEVATGRRRIELKIHDVAFGVAFSPDGRLLAVGSMDGTVWLWELPSGRMVGRLTGHRGWVLSVAFSPDGKRLVSGGLDTTALVWDLTPYLNRPGSCVLTPSEAQRCWLGLAGDAAVAYGAMAKLLGSDDGGVAALCARLKAPALAEKKIDRLIAELGSNSFAVRANATRELEKLGDKVEIALREGVKRHQDIEIKRRLARILERLDRLGPSKETLCHVRAIEALEMHGTAEARRLLDALSKGAAYARLTHEAKEASQRLRRR